MIRDATASKDAGQPYYTICEVFYPPTNTGAKLPEIRICMLVCRLAPAVDEAPRFLTPRALCDYVAGLVSSLQRTVLAWDGEKLADTEEYPPPLLSTVPRAYRVVRVNSAGESYRVPSPRGLGFIEASALAQDLGAQDKLSKRGGWQYKVVSESAWEAATKGA